MGTSGRRMSPDPFRPDLASRNCGEEPGEPAPSSPKLCSERRVLLLQVTPCAWLLVIKSSPESRGLRRARRGSGEGCLRGIAEKGESSRKPPLVLHGLKGRQQRQAHRLVQDHPALDRISDLGVESRVGNRSVARPSPHMLSLILAHQDFSRSQDEDDPDPGHRRSLRGPPGPIRSPQIQGADVPGLPRGFTGGGQVRSPDETRSRRRAPAPSRAARS